MTRAEMRQEAVRRFLDSRCTLGEDEKVAKPDLYMAYVDWHRQRLPGTPLGNTVLSREILKLHRLDTWQSADGTRHFLGLGLRGQP
jgi:hypothetical protein